MRSFRAPIAIVSLILGLLVILGPQHVALFATCCMIAIALSLLEISVAIDTKRYREIGVQALLLSAYVTGLISVGRG
jgi:hypothetical protein